MTLAGVCGSDLHPYRGHHGPRTPPLVLGHEAIGRVDGDEHRYVVFPIVSCGACPACLRGKENLCATRGLLGLDRQGVFAETVAIEAHSLTQIPAAVDDRVAVLTEPFACAVSALRYAGAAPGQHVLVVGGGPIGLLTTYACAIQGIEVSAVEPVASRRALAADLGATRVAAAVSDASLPIADIAIDAVGIEATSLPAGCDRQGAHRRLGDGHRPRPGRGRGGRRRHGAAGDHAARPLRLHAGRLRRRP